MTHGDDFVLTGPTKKTDRVREENDKCLSHQGEDHQPLIAKEHQDVKQEVALARGRNRVPT